MMRNSKNNFLYIQRPKVEGNIVYFSWNMDFDPKKSTNDIYVDYYDVDISAVPMQVHYNTIIGLLLNHLIDLPISTVVITEDVVSEEIAAFWTNYHGLQNVYFANVGHVHLEKSTQSSTKGTVGILYGGGKDSYYALDILSKNSQINKVNLISFVIPDAHVNVKELEERRDKLILDAVSQKYTVDVIKIKTNARAIIKGYHLELYFAPMGVLAWLNLFDYVTFSYEFCHYFIPNSPTENFGFERSHVNYIQKVSEFYSTHLSTRPLAIFNANQHMTELSSFGYLAAVNPDFYKTLVMCESTTDPNKKWCCSCTKCGEFTLFSMYYNLNQSDIDIDWFFSQSPWILRAIENIKQMKQKGVFIKGTTFILHFDSFKFVLNKLKERNFEFKSLQAKENFAILTDYYTELKTVNEDGFYVDVLNQVYPKPLIQDSYDILKNYLPESQSPSEKTSGIGKLIFDAQVQPRFLNRRVGISSSQVYQILAKQNNFPVFNSDPIDGYLENYHLKTKGILEKEISIKSNFGYVDIHINKNPLVKNDGFELELILSDLTKQGYSYGTFLLEIPHCSQELSLRFELSVQVNDREEKILLSNRNTKVNFALIKESKNPSIKISFVAKKDLEAWNWGRAGRIRIGGFKLHKQNNSLKIMELDLV